MNQALLAKTWQPGFFLYLRPKTYDRLLTSGDLPEGMCKC